MLLGEGGQDLLCSPLRLDLCLAAGTWARGCLAGLCLLLFQRSNKAASPPETERGHGGHRPRQLGPAARGGQIGKGTSAKQKTGSPPASVTASAVGSVWAGSAPCRRGVGTPQEPERGPGRRAEPAVGADGDSGLNPSLCWLAKCSMEGHWSPLAQGCVCAPASPTGFVALCLWLNSLPSLLLQALPHTPTSPRSPHPHSVPPSPLPLLLKLPLLWGLPPLLLPPTASRCSAFGLFCTDGSQPWRSQWTCSPGQSNAREVTSPQEMMSQLYLCCLWFFGHNV